MSFRGLCDACGSPVTTEQRAAFRVRGWELERKAGGANYIAGKERQVGRIAHAHCIEAKLAVDRQGLRGQMTL